MSDSNCIFCKIIAGGIPAKKIYEDEWVLCIEDIKPSAPIHYLFLPKRHFRSLIQLEMDRDGNEGAKYLEKIFAAMTTVAKKEGIHERGFRTSINTGEEGGQTVFHLHVHMLGGKKIKGHV